MLSQDVCKFPLLNATKGEGYKYNYILDKRQKKPEKMKTAWLILMEARGWHEIFFMVWIHAVKRGVSVKEGDTWSWIRVI